MIAARCSCILILRATAALCAIVCLPPCMAQAPDPVAELVKQAEARQAKVESLDVKLRITEVQSDTIPVAHDTTLTSENRLVVRGTSFRYEDNHPQFDVPASSRRAGRQIAAADGAVMRIFYPNLNGGLGSIRQETGGGGWIASSPVSLPLAMAFRAATPSFAFPELRKLKPSGAATPIDGVDCAGYELGSGTAKYTLWMDGSGLLRRWQFDTRGVKGDRRCDIRYERRYGADAFPVLWVVQASPSRSVKTRTTVEVIAARVNEDVADAEFDIAFPAGSTVHKDNKEYHVQDDGELHAVDAGRGSDKPGFIARNQKWIGLGLAAVVVLVLAGYVVRLRWRR